MLRTISLFAIAALIYIVPATTFAQPTYDVNSTSTPPTIDGVVSAGEWDAAAAEAGGWRILREPLGPLAPNNNRFRMMWDATNLYILYETDFGTYRDDNVRAQIRFGYNNINLYFDPDLDGEGNQGTETEPFFKPDGYQIAVNMYLGTYTCDSGCSVEDNGSQFNALDQGPVGLSSFASAVSAGATSANDLGWLGMRGTQIGTVNGTSGGVFEIAIPWSDFDAPGLDPAGEDPGLNLNGEIPVAGDQWNFNIGFVGQGDVLPVWSWHENPDPDGDLEIFATQPHGVLTFVSDDAVLLGDCNLNMVVDFDDIAPFITILANDGFLEQADINGDDVVDFDDIAGFITILAGS